MVNPSSNTANKAAVIPNTFETCRTQYYKALADQMSVESDNIVFYE